MASLALTSDLLSLLGEPTRVRLLALLAVEDMTVADLAAATDLGQSRVSTHLARLKAAGIVTDRRVGSATFYALSNGMSAPARRVWSLVEEEVKDPALERDRERWRARAAAWPDAVAGQMDRHYSPGRTWESLGRCLVGLLGLGDVLDAGGGDGAVAELLAPRCRSYVLVDRNDKLVAAARQRLRGQRGVTASRADLAELPFSDASFDVALLLNVLVEVAEPGRVLAELHRTLRPDGRIAVVSLAAHDHAELAAAYRHVHPGFAPATLKKLLGHAGFIVDGAAITSRERRPPRLEVVTAFGRKPA